MIKSEPGNNGFPLCRMETGRGGIASCAACCGMYNWRGFNRDMVKGILSRQTELFENRDGTEGNILEIKNELSGSRPAPLFPVIHNCEFLGFMDAGRKRVGCLLHPSRHKGENLRALSKHGRETCDEARCTAYHYLSHDLARCVAAAAGDWYLYGLCLTDIDLTRSFFDAASEKLNEAVPIPRLISSPALLELFSDYLCLKERWPFARDPGRFGKYCFPDGTYRIARIDYQGLGMKPSRHDRILLSLGSVFHEKDELMDAEEIIEEKISRFAEACAREAGS